jgi:1-acyl-sn-glycerol-3-phosphate acyltransferase
MQINPKNRIELYPGVIRIRIADPIPIIGSSGAQRDLVMEQVKMAIEAGLES